MWGAVLGEDLARCIGRDPAVYVVGGFLGEWGAIEYLYGECPPLATGSEEAALVRARQTYNETWLCVWNGTRDHGDIRSAEMVEAERLLRDAGVYPETNRMGRWLPKEVRRSGAGAGVTTRRGGITYAWYVGKMKIGTDERLCKTCRNVRLYTEEERALRRADQLVVLGYPCRYAAGSLGVSEELLNEEFERRWHGCNFLRGDEWAHPVCDGSGLCGDPAAAGVLRGLRYWNAREYRWIERLPSAWYNNNNKGEGRAEKALGVCRRVGTKRFVESVRVVYAVYDQWKKTARPRASTIRSNVERGEGWMGMRGMRGVLKKMGVSREQLGDCFEIASAF